MSRRRRVSPVRPKSAQGRPVRTEQPGSKTPKTALDYELTTKRRGELSELAFVYKAASLGFHVAKPYGDSERYDFILDAGHRLWRVQVKSTTTLIGGLYRIKAFSPGQTSDGCPTLAFLARVGIRDLIELEMLVPTALRTAVNPCPQQLSFLLQTG